MIRGLSDNEWRRGYDIWERILQILILIAENYDLLSWDFDQVISHKCCNRNESIFWRNT